MMIIDVIETLQLDLKLLSKYGIYYVLNPKLEKLGDLDFLLIDLDMGLARGSVGYFYRFDSPIGST